MSYYEYHVARRYVQFEGALKELANYISLFGKKALLLTNCGPVKQDVEKRIREGFELPAKRLMNASLAIDSARYRRYYAMTDRLDELRRDLEYEFFDLDEMPVAEENIEKVSEMVRAGGYDTVVGVGGGKAQDFARAITHYVPVKVVLVPTLAATNASVSTLSVLYTPDGKNIDKYLRMDNAPELVLVDTEILIHNPKRMFSAGIGDIAATYYEALCNLRMAESTENLPVFAEEGIQLSVDILKKQAPGALEALKIGKINRAFETVVSMIMHNCGPLNMICLTGYAHILDEMFLYFEKMHALPHGLRVGYGVLPMLAFIGASEEEQLSYYRFCKSTGIPTSLKEMGMDQYSREDWQKAFDQTVGKKGSLSALPYTVNAQTLIDSLFAAERIANSF
ncbi:MAG: iron-containing alcohol dehydrogenase [Clostridia bacterium]|nr:iron-containing alcohol dehydrogenase [Clostridia bacterium]